MQESSFEHIHRVFETQMANQFIVGNSSVGQRKAKLKKLLHALFENRAQIQEAMIADMRKHPSETDLTEIYPVISEIKHAIKSLERWLSKDHRTTPLALIGSSSYVKHEPKGVVLIISPWNFPFNLTFGPLVSAIAAGNCVMIKPSEMTPHSSALMKKIISELFEESEVCLFEGAVETSQYLLELPFNHIFFTGSPEVGKIVMTAAAKNLSSVTLELGGKSPIVIDKTANLKLAAKRIAWGKFMNNGQICIAPDYVLIDESKKDAFVTELSIALKNFYTDNAANAESYGRIVSSRHFDRLKSALNDSVQHGAKVLIGGKHNKEERFIEPTIIGELREDSVLMTEEIFGPILPLKTFKSIEEAIEIINAKERPLALYIYSNSNKNIKKILDNTRSGGTCINHNTIHFNNVNLGFGGVNNSGMGRAHGDEGFKTFSNPRGVFTQHTYGAIDLIMPPYNGFKQRLIDITLRWF